MESNWGLAELAPPKSGYTPFALLCGWKILLRGSPQSLHGTFNECFCPLRAKNISPKNWRNQKWQQFAENQVWHVSCIHHFHDEIFKRTQDLLRVIWRSARGVNTARRTDLQLDCPQPTFRFNSFFQSRPAVQPTRPGLVFLREEAHSQG
ncbi:MAG: hypothetical protein WBW41_12655 [Verrucomicrobiia bacterium]